jgi:hypothetical protein
MKNNKLTYEEIIGLLKNTSPVLERPEELTQTVMAQIEHLSKNKKKYKIIRITGLLSGAVASLLICLLAYESIQQSIYQYNESKISVNLSDDKRTLNTFNTIQSHTIDGLASENGIIAEIIKEKSKRREMKTRIFSHSSNQNNHSKINL